MDNPVMSVIRREEIDIEEMFRSLPRETQGHSERVASLSALLLGWAVEAFPGEYGEDCTPDLLRRAARYHDIGLVLVPERVLQKDGDLTGPEFRVVKKHALYGSSLLEDYGRTPAGTGEAAFWQLAAEIALGHHERWDGKGYPFGQLVDATPEAVRVVSVADAFDSIVQGGNYRIPLPMEYAVLEIMQNAGKQFDPRLAELFRERFDLAFDLYRELGG